MVVEVSCRCGWFTEPQMVENIVVAELVAERHEQLGWRRAYAHETEIRELEGA